MLAGGALPVEVAIQLGSSAAPGDEVAIATLLKAAQALSTTDPGASADLSRRALELAPERHSLRGPLVVQAAMSLHAAGRIDEAKIFADDALRDVLPVAEEAAVRLGIAGMWLVSPDVRVHASREALKLPRLPADLRVAHMAKLAYNLLAGGRTEEAQTAFIRGRGGRRAPRPGRPIPARAERRRARLRQRALHATHSSGFETILRDGVADPDGLDELLTRLWRASALFALDRADDALDAADGIIADALKRGFAYFLHVAEITRGQLLLQMGRLDDASLMLDGRFDPHEAPVTTPMDAAGVVASRAAGAPHRRRPADPPDQRDRQGDAEREHPGRPPSRRLVAQSPGRGRRRPSTRSPVAACIGRSGAQAPAREAVAGPSRRGATGTDGPRRRRSRARRERGRRREPTRRAIPRRPLTRGHRGTRPRTARRRPRGAVARREALRAKPAVAGPGLGLGGPRPRAAAAGDRGARDRRAQRGAGALCAGRGDSGRRETPKPAASARDSPPDHDS